MILFGGKKKRGGSREGGGCVLRRGPRGGEKGSGTQASCSRKPGAQGRVFARKSSGPVPSFRAGNFCGSMLVPHPPVLQKGKVASPLVVLFRCPVELGYCQLRSPSLYLPFREPQETAEMNPLFLGRSQSKSRFTTCFYPTVSRDTQLHAVLKVIDFSFLFGLGKSGPRLVKGFATWSFHTIGFPFKECRSWKWESCHSKNQEEWWKCWLYLHPYT